MNESGGEKIDLNIEELENTDQSSKLVIDEDDLLAVEPPPKVYPGLSDQPINQQEQKPVSIAARSLLYLALAGLVGGIMAWLLTEFSLVWDRSAYQETMEVLINVSFFFSIIGGIIGAFLGSIEGLTSRVTVKILKGIAVGLLVGFIGGAVGGFAGQYVYSELGGGLQDDIMLQILIRGFGWALVGLFIGLGHGLGTGGGKKIINGLLGGLIGGTIGGLLFDVIASIIMGGATSRAVAIGIMGLFSGLAIGLVQEIRKDAWLKVLEGATAGKEYIIHSDKNRIGSSPKNDIVLVKDQGVSVYHAEINIASKAYIISDLQDTGGVWVNSRKIAQHRLKNGDMIYIGNYRLQYFEKSRG